MTKPKYDEKLVDEMLDALESFGVIWSGVYAPSKTERLANAMEALRPKPKKFYVLPEWSEFCEGKNAYKEGKNYSYVSLVECEVDRSTYNALREATATDKPLVHIPAGKDWSEEEIENVWDVNFVYGLISARQNIIDAIKTKLESQIKGRMNHDIC